MAFPCVFRYLSSETWNPRKSHQKLMPFRCVFGLNFEDEGATCFWFLEIIKKDFSLVFFRNWEQGNFHLRFSDAFMPHVLKINENKNASSDFFYPIMYRWPFSVSNSIGAEKMNDTSFCTYLWAALLNLIRKMVLFPY